MKTIHEYDAKIAALETELAAQKKERDELANSGIRFGNNTGNGTGFIKFVVNGGGIQVTHNGIKVADAQPNVKVNDTTHLPELKKMLELAEYISQFTEPLRSTIEKIEKAGRFESVFKEETE